MHHYILERINKYTYKRYSEDDTEHVREEGSMGDRYEEEKMDDVCSGNVHDVCMWWMCR